MREENSILGIRYKAACNDYAYELMRRWNISTDDCWWAGDEVGGVWLFNEGELSIKMEEIIYCVNNDVAFDTFIGYINYCVACSWVGLSVCSLKSYISNDGRYSQAVLDNLVKLKEDFECAIRSVKKKNPF